MNDSLVRPGQHGAFVEDEGFHFQSPPAPLSNALTGLRLAVKDVFDVQGWHTGVGSPTWRAQHPPGTRTAVAVQRLLDAGPQWVGQTVTDELTYSLAGINAHYGTPVNPASPTRLPGGSSSGSAVAVAGDHADIALGTDCGGSIRLPASYCGVWGIRPTHGRVAAQGCFTLAHSFDTIGCFAQNGALLARTFAQLVGSLPAKAWQPGPLNLSLWHSLRIAELLDPGIQTHWEALLSEGIADTDFTPLPSHMDQAMDLPQWAAAFRTLQAAEVWQQHGRWYGEHSATLGPDIQQRFEAAGQITATEVASAQIVRVQAQALTAQLLQTPHSVLILPTVPTIAPALTDSLPVVNEVRQRSQQLLCIAGLSGLPQVNFPWTHIDGAPIGLSVIGARGDDEHVLSVAQFLHHRISRSETPT